MGFVGPRRTQNAPTTIAATNKNTAQVAKSSTRLKNVIVLLLSTFPNTNFNSTQPVDETDSSLHRSNAGYSRWKLWTAWVMLGAGRRIRRGRKALRVTLAGSTLSVFLWAGTALAIAETGIPLPRDRPGSDAAAVAPPAVDAARPSGAPPIPRARPVVAQAAPAEAVSAPPVPPAKPAEAGSKTVGPPEEGSAERGDAVPLPEPKPAETGQADAPPAAGPEAVPLPAAKPADDPAPSGDAAQAGPPEPPLPEARPDHTAQDDAPSTPPDVSGDADALSPACPAIEEGRVLGRPLPPIREEGCEVAAAYSIAYVGSGRSVRLEPEAVLNCAIAERLDEFVEKVVEPAATEMLGSALTGLGIAGSFVCRTRNGRPDAPPSEHGKANAVDIASFALADGRVIAVSPGWEDEGEAGAFLRAVHEKACGPFTTVLGPDADAFHQDHLHLDLQRRGADGRTTFCQ